MSLPNAQSRRRSVVPRWRSLLNTPTIETVATPIFTDFNGTSEKQFRNLLKIWRREARPEDAVDIMDAGIACGSRSLAVEGAKKILSFQEIMKPRVVERANAIIFGKPPFVRASQLAYDEIGKDNLYLKIKRLKSATIESPRNSIAHVEIARIYSLLAQFGKAEHHLRVAITLAPNDRFVLRALTRFYTMINEGGEALKCIWRSDAVKVDPWIQSAELAAADLMGRSTKYAHAAAKKLQTRPFIDMSSSELATGWLSSGAHKNLKIKEVAKRLQRTLSHPTENALAQGIWLLDPSGLPFKSRFPNFHFTPDAYEAESLALIEEKEFHLAEAETQKWHMDQPFQSRSAIQLSSLNFTHERNYEKSRAVAEQGLHLHQGDWMLLNLAAISNAYLGNFDKAANYIFRFEKVASDLEQKCFLSAAKGLLDFEQGRAFNGLDHYLAAADLAKKTRRADLAINAVTFLTEQLTKHQYLDLNELKKVEDTLFKSVKKLPLSEQIVANNVWVARKKVMDDFVLEPGSQTLPRLLSPELLKTALDEQ